MKFPPLKKPTANLKSGYTAAYVKRYMKACVYLALKENSVDWENISKEEILALIPEGETEIEKFVHFAKKIDAKLMRINTWHI